MDKSNYTLGKIREIIDRNRSSIDMDRIEAGVYQGIRILKEKIEHGGIDRDDFLEKLERVIHI